MGVELQNGCRLKGKETAMKKYFVRWLLIFGILAALIGGCAPPGPSTPQVGLPTSIEQPTSLR